MNLDEGCRSGGDKISVVAVLVSVFAYGQRKSGEMRGLVNAGAKVWAPRKG